MVQLFDEKYVKQFNLREVSVREHWSSYFLESSQTKPSAN